MKRAIFAAALSIICGASMAANVAEQLATLCRNHVVGAEACNMAADLYMIDSYQKTGVRQDRELSLRWRKEACTEGYAPACSMAAIMLAGPSDATEDDHAIAKAMLERGCAGKDSMSCDMLADELRYFAPAPNEDLFRQVEELQRKACKYATPYISGLPSTGNADYCCSFARNLLSKPNLTEGDEREAYQAYTRGCFLGSSQACIAAKKLKGKLAQ
nr:MAG TPA_asm: hypothetical protein [Caudoviricetes sp.]